MSEQQIKIAIAVGGVASGGVGGYILAKKTLEKKYRAIADEEIESVKNEYGKQLLNKEGLFATPESAASALGLEVVEAEEVEGYSEELAEAEALIAEAGYSAAVMSKSTSVVIDTPEGEAVVVEERTVSIFDEEPPSNPALEWDPDEHADPDNPYEIPMEEWANNDKGFEQITIHYYDLDDTLADERETIIPDVEGVIGSDNLEKFGNMSQDENIVYVRNEKLSADFEVLREQGSYAAKVMGVNEEFLEETGRAPKARKLKDDRDT